LQGNHVQKPMKKTIPFLICVLLVFCTNKDATRKAEAQKTELKRKEIFENISTEWYFQPANFSEKSYSILQQWLEWNIFYNELLQKPQTDINAFQRKTTLLVKQIENLQSTIPDVFNQTEIQSRFSVLETKFKLLKTYITLDDISTENVIKTIAEINTEIESIANRMKTILEKNKIQYEQTEHKMLQSMDSLQQNNSSDDNRT